MKSRDKPTKRAFNFQLTSVAQERLQWNPLFWQPLRLVLLHSRRSFKTLSIYFVWEIKCEGSHRGIKKHREYWKFYATNCQCLWWQKDWFSRENRNPLRRRRLLNTCPVGFLVPCTRFLQQFLWRFISLSANKAPSLPHGAFLVAHFFPERLFLKDLFMERMHVTINMTTATQMITRFLVKGF